MRLKMTVNGTDYVVDVETEPEVRPVPAPIVLGGGAAAAVVASPAAAAAGANAVTAPLAGSVARINVEVGDKVEVGQVVAVLEAMKMETEISSPKAGVVEAILVEVREAVQGGQAIINLAE